MPVRHVAVAIYGAQYVPSICNFYDRLALRAVAVLEFGRYGHMPALMVYIYNFEPGGWVVRCSWFPEGTLQTWRLHATWGSCSQQLWAFMWGNLQVLCQESNSNSILTDVVINWCIPPFHTTRRSPLQAQLENLI